MRDVMIDLETLGVAPGCVVLSIGATDGDRHFSVKIDVENSVDQGLVIEPRTVIWWMQQSENARNLITEPGTNLDQAITAFCDYFDWKESRVWCNGAAFDFPILKAAFKAVGRKTLPWPYYNEMDFRTIKNLVPKEVFKTLQVNPTVAHDGLEDALAQWKTLQGMLCYLEDNNVNLRVA